jgi:hypothetical protein
VKRFWRSTGTHKRALLWSALFFVAAEAAASLVLNGWRPEWRDPSFGLRLRALQQRRQENPSAPLVLVLGSSRALHGLAPIHALDSLNQLQPRPLVFNFGVTGAGSVRELMTFRRLMAAGIKPDWLLIESWPVLWPEDGIFAERRLLADDEFYWSDLSVLSRYLPGKLALFGRVLKGNLVPLVSYRSRLLHAVAGPLLPRDLDRRLRREDADWTPSDGTGWLPYRTLPANPQALRREVDKGRLAAAPLLNPLRIAPDSDRALHALLDECRTAGIKTALFLMPEHSECRRWYAPRTQILVRGYLAGLSAEYGLPVFDLRAWSSDECFADFCHLAPYGVQAFSQRFGRDVLRPWLNGEPLSRDILLCGQTVCRRSSAP